MAETKTTDPYRTYLREDQIPTAWYNLRADMPEKPASVSVMIKALLSMTQ